ncbi:hypothetical protein ACTWPB_02480 [Nocardia sp. IBHARD005]|uniref:hypothetical protein n=1 Tax=Nocardia sp. IBHARD005 TaxID=3457765 RepID=UPI00405A2641
MKVLGACPLDCPDACSWVVTVEDGVATGLRGNKEHLVTRGALCVKVNRYLELGHVVVSLGAHDTEFIAEHTEGWPEFRDRIEEFTPERVTAISELRREQIVALGERIARTRPTAIRASQGMQRHAGGGMALRVLGCLPGVTGDWAIPGGGLHYSTSGHFRIDDVERTRRRAAG